jgi:transcriptional regulatory protein RtcR
MKKIVVLGLIGSVLDAGRGKKRWEKWRPTVNLCQHEDLLVDRFELIIQPENEHLARVLEQDIAGVSPETDLNIHTIPMADPWDFEEVYETLHEFVRDYPFDPEHEDYLVHITTGTHVVQICLFLLAETHAIPGKLLQTSPPTRARNIDHSTYTIIDLDLSKYDRIASRFEKETINDVTFLKSGINTLNVEFNSMIEELERVAVRSKEAVLLMGPTGAGKTQLARRIYELKQMHRNVQGSFVEINCATLRGDQAMSMLFGHTKGSFTGASQARGGLLREADDGILFLDEIGELGMDEQAMLLRAIESGKFLPVGSDKEVQSKFQLIVGTNRNLLEQVQNGQFREDLFARINLWTYRLPGLAERPEDIPANIDFELEQYAEKQHAHITFNKEARQRFHDFAISSEAIWKANFRDLNGAINRMATLSEGGRITKELVDQEIDRLNFSWRTIDKPNTQYDVERWLDQEALESIDPFDRPQLAYTLQICGQSKSLSDAGRTLFAVSRNQRKSTNDSDRLRKYLAKYDLSWESIQSKE